MSYKRCRAVTITASLSVSGLHCIAFFNSHSEPDSKSEGGAGDQQQQQPLSAAEVCLFGLNIVMPLMTLELLKFPSLCLQYFRTVTLVCEIYPEKVRGTEIAQNVGTL